MKHFKKFALITCILAFSILACAIPGVEIPIPSAIPIDALGTTVAGTLTALPPLFPVELTPGTGTEVAPPLPTPPPVPDPLHVVYVKNGDVWVWTEAGIATQITFTADVQGAEISSDGLLVAYMRQTGEFNQELWAINFDGSTPRQLVSGAALFASFSGSASDVPSGVGVYQFDWQPGSHNLYYNTRPLFMGPGSMSYDDLYKVDADTLVAASVFSASQGGKFAFSPNGAKMAIIRPTGISIANADGSGLHSNVLLYSSVMTYSEYLYYPNPVWAGDSSGLRLVIPPGDPMITPLPASSLFYLPSDGSGSVAAGGILAVPFDWPDEAISPSLGKLAYAKSVGAPADNMRELHIANADTSGDYVFITGKSLSFLGWLPNSTQFVFRITEGSGVGTHVGNLDGSQVTLSTDPTLITDIRWPDNTHFLYRWRTGSNYELRYNVLSGAGSTLIDSGEIWDYDFDN